MKKQLFSAALLCLVSGLLCGCTRVEAAQDEVRTAVIEFAGDTVRLSGGGAAATDGGVEITAGGTYRLTGVSENGRVVVKAPSESVTLLLDGLDLTCPTDEAIYIKEAGAAELALAEGTANTVVSGEAPADTDGDGEDASGAAIRAKCPLTVTGAGELTVCGYINNGVAAAGDLAVESGSLTVTAMNDGLKSDGSIVISGGVFDLAVRGDGIQAGDTLTVTGGTFDILTGSGADEENMKAGDSAMMGGMGGGPGGGSREPSQESSPAEATGGTDTETAEAGSQAASPEPSGPEMNWDMDDDDVPSRKGLKAENAVSVSGGVFTINTEDDAVHSNGDVTVTGGAFSIRAGDDGVHGDSSLTVAGGSLDIGLCYEGLEARSILIADGYVSVAAADDGMNANGGMMFGPGASGEAGSESGDAPVLRITGGTVLVDSGGDGLDSNGSLYIDGGRVYISGPATNWDAAIDCGEGSSEFVITGGVLMAAGYSGMAEAPDSAEGAQPSIYYAQSEYCPEGAAVTLTDGAGNVLLERAFAHSFNSVVLSCPALTVGESYTLSMGGTETVIEMTSAGFSNRAMGGPGGMGGPSGGPGASREPSQESAAETDAAA